MPSFEDLDMRGLVGDGEYCRHGRIISQYATCADCAKDAREDARDAAFHAVLDRLSLAIDRLAEK